MPGTRAAWNCTALQSLYGLSMPSLVRYLGSTATSKGQSSSCVSCCVIFPLRARKFNCISGSVTRIIHSVQQPCFVVAEVRSNEMWIAYVPPKGRWNRYSSNVDSSNTCVGCEQHRTVSRMVSCVTQGVNSLLYAFWWPGSCQCHWYCTVSDNFIAISALTYIVLCINLSDIEEIHQSFYWHIRTFISDIEMKIKEMDTPNQNASR